MNFIPLRSDCVTLGHMAAGAADSLWRRTDSALVRLAGQDGRRDAARLALLESLHLPTGQP